MPWKPLNKYCWDFWFAYQEQTLHVFYLQANQLACAYNAERRHSLASVGHAVMTDFGWQEIAPDEPALSKREGNYWDNVSIWTGSVIKKHRYYMFYTSRCSFDPFVLTTHERRQPQNIGVAVSDDLITWRRTTASEKHPVIPNPGEGSKFDGVSWRDPYVIEDSIDKKFYAFICACPQDAPTDAGGVVAFVTSLDLENWYQDYGILYHSSEFRYLEVPQVFWRKFPDCWRLYLLFSPYWNRFFERRDPKGTYYVYSQPIEDRSKVNYKEISWEEKSATLLIDGVYGGKLVNTEAENPVFFGFPLEDEAGHFVGGISDPMRAVFNENGRIKLSNFS